jgi:PAS domain S-box-containing protein
MKVEKLTKTTVIIGTASLAIVITLLYLACFSHLDFKKNVISRSQNLQLTIAHTAAKGIKSYFNYLQDTLHLLSKLPVFKEGDKNHIHATLQAAFRRQEIIPTILADGTPMPYNMTSLRLINKNGILIDMLPDDPTRLARNIGVDYLHHEDQIERDLFVHPWKTGRFFITKSHFHPGGLSIEISAPIYVDNKFHGVIIAGIDPQEIYEKYIKSIKIGKAGHAWVADDNGVILYHRQEELIGAKINMPQEKTEPVYKRQKFTGNIVSGGKGSLDTLPDEPRLIAYAPLRIGDLSWSVVVGVPYSELAAPFNKNAFRTMLIAGGIILIVSLGSIFLWKANLKSVKARSEAQHLQTLFDNIPHVVYVINPDDHTILYTNHCTRAIFGETAGMKCFELMHGKKESCDFCKLPHLFSDPVKKTVSFECQNKRSKRTYNATSTLINWHDGKKVFYQIAVDITELKETQEKFGQRLRFERLIATVASQLARAEDPINVFDKVLEGLGNHVQVSRSYIFSIDHENQKCSNTHEWTAPGISPQIEQLQDLPWSVAPWFLNEINAGRSIVSNDMSDIPSPDRDMLEEQDIKSIIVLPLRIENRSIGFIGFDECNGPRTWHEDELLLLAVADMIAQAQKRHEDIKAKETALHQLINADRLSSLGTLVAGVAHEVNNPNNFISFNIPLLAKYWNVFRPVLNEYAEKHPEWRIGDLTFLELCEDTEELFQDIQTGSDRIKEIVKDLKDFARIDQSGPGEPFDIAECVDRSIKICGAELQKKIHELNVVVSENLPQVVGHRQRIEQVFINILLNATKAVRSRQDSIVRLYVSLDSPKTIRIDIEDNGIGMSEEVMCHIFDPFFTTHRESGGTGLGLSVSYGIVNDHHGKILVESTPGQGTRFSVILPVEPDEIVVAPHPKLLVVDDNQETVAAFTECIATRGRHIIGLTDPREAAAQLEKDPQISFVFLDQYMPHFTGIDLISILRKIRPSIKVYIISGQFGPEFANEAVQAGANGFIQKPIRDFDKVFRLIGMDLGNENTAG